MEKLKTIIAFTIVMSVFILGTLGLLLALYMCVDEFGLLWFFGTILCSLALLCVLGWSIVRIIDLAEEKKRIRRET